MTYSLNRVELTPNEETCILHFLRQAEDVGTLLLMRNGIPSLTLSFANTIPLKFRKLNHGKHYEH